jgi:hypothetical protein
VIQVVGPVIGVDRILDLIVTSFVESAQVEPYFRDIWVQADCAGVRVEGIAILINLIV